MRVKILGSAAGGGFPQWNCGCANCHLYRTGKFPGKARSQAQVAISSDGVCWFLLGASPDLRAQIESCHELHPRSGPRHSPISGVVIASADVDQCLGLLLLREFQPLNVYATESATRILREQNSMFAMLNRGPQATCWQTIHAGYKFELCTPVGAGTGITCTPVSVSSRYPMYVRNPEDFSAEDAALGLRVSSGGKTVAYFPSCGELTDTVREAITDVDLLLFDGTFFSDDELAKIVRSGPRAHEIDHLPVGGENGSLRQLTSLSAKRKMYIHINNTNPMLNESSAEYQSVRNAGWELAEDGWQAVL